MRSLVTPVDTKVNGIEIVTGITFGGEVEWICGVECAKIVGVTERNVFNMGLVLAMSLRRSVLEVNIPGSIKTEPGYEL